MSIVSFLLVFAAACILLWLVQKFLPDNILKKILMVALVVAVVFWGLSVIGVFDALRGVKVPTVR